jgi:hypothetical protein
MKHCSQGSSNRVKNTNTGNHTLISRTQILRNFYLDFVIKEKQFASQVVFPEISMQQQIFLQQMQMHISAMEKHTDTSKKYLWRIANFMTIHNSKR